MTRWENQDWPVKQGTRIQTALEIANGKAEHTAWGLGVWMILMAVFAGVAIDETVRGFVFVWQCLHTAVPK